MRSAKLRHWMTIQKPSRQQDQTTGGMSTKWVDVDSMWGQYTPIRPREFIAAGAPQGEVTGEMVIRFHPSVDATMRVIHDGKAFQIVGPPLPDRKSGREYLTLSVSAGVAI